MPNTQPWEYQEQEIRHETTGAIGARTPQGDIVYGPLAKQYLTPIESVPKITIPEAEAPATAPGMSLIDKTPESWILQQQEQMQARIKEQQRQLEDKQQERKGIIEQTKEFLGGVPKMETTVRDLYQEFGAVSALQRQQTILDTIMQTRQQAVTLQEQRGAAIAVLEQQGTSPYLTGQQARIAESFDRRINTLAAQEAAQVAHYQAEQGNVQQARGLVSDIVDAMTYDTNLELTKMQTFLDINKDEISMLDTSIQRDLQETTRQLENQLNQEKQERTAVLELSLTHFNAGISPNDTLENAVVKAQQWLNIQPDARVEDLMAQFPTAGIDSKDTFAEAITKIARMPQAPAGTPKAPQVFGGQQTGYFSWTQDAQGNWVPQQVVGGTSGGSIGGGTQEVEETPMPVLDVKRYVDMYPEAGIMAGDTEKEARFKVYLEYTLKEDIKNMLGQGADKKEIDAELDSIFDGNPPQEVVAVKNNAIMEYEAENSGMLESIKDWFGNISLFGNTKPSGTTIRIGKD